MQKLSITLFLSLLLLGVGGAASAADLSPALEQVFAASADNELVPVVIFLESRLTMDEVYPDARNLPMDQRREYVVSVLKDRFKQMSPHVMQRLELARKTGETTLLRPLWILNAVRTHASAKVLRELQTYPEVLYLAYDPPYENTLDDGWGVTEIGALQVQDELGVAGAGVLIGHKDSGINYTLSGFTDRIWINPGEDLNGNGIIDGTEENGIDDDGNGYVDDFRGWNFDRDTNNVMDDDSHGTRTASIICSNPIACERIAAAPEATLMILLGYRYQGAVWEASQYAIEHGVQVLSASLSFKQSGCADADLLDCPNRVAHRWVSEMELAAGIIHANSTGNEGTNNPIPLSTSAPSDCPPPAMTDSHPQQGGVSSIVSVAAYESSGNYYTGSGRGPSGWSREDICVNPRSPFCGPVGSASEFPPEFEDYPYRNGTQPGLLKPDITAPTGAGTDPMALGINGNCSSVGGTSGATPHVGGALALIYSAFPGITPEEAYIRLVEGATDMGDPGADNTWGFGKLNVYNAIAPVLSTIGTVSGMVTSGVVPIPGARIAIGDRRPIYTDLSGNFTTSLVPGSYEIEFYKYGYQTISNMIMVMAGPNEINVEMDAASAASLTITLDDGEIPWGPGVGNVSVELYAGEISGVTNAQGVVQFQNVYTGTHEFVIGENQDFYNIAVVDIDVAVGTNSTTIPLNASESAFPTGDPDIDGYVAYDNLDIYGPGYDWVEINPNLGGTGSQLPFNGGDACVTRTMPFSFTFYGQIYTTLYISPNGYVAFSGCDAATDWDIQPIPSTELPDAYISPMKCDFYPEDADGGDVYCYDVKQWTGFPPGRATFQVILTPTSDSNAGITFQYAAIAGRIESTIGIENGDGTMGLQYCYQLQYSQGSAPIRAGRVIRFEPEFLDAADDQISVPSSFVLHQNYPNPFNPSTTFTFEAPRASDVRLSLFDLLGRETATVFDGRSVAGVNRITYDASNLPTGMYFARLSVEGKSVGLKKVMLLK
jgi:hypothetical protein